MWHAEKCIEPCGAFVSESKAPRVSMSSLGSGSPFGESAVGLVGFLAIGDLFGVKVSVRPSR